MQKHNTLKPNLFYKNIPIYADSEEPHQVIFEKIKKFLPHDGSVLDLGAGAGALTQRIVDAGYQITAADLHEETFLAKADFVTVDLNKDFTNHFDGKNYGCIVATEVIEHLETPLHFLNQISKLLKKDGFALIPFPNIYIYGATISFLSRGDFINWNTDQYLSTGHQTILTDWLFEQHCKKNNLLVTDKIFCSKLPVHNNIVKRLIVHLYLNVIELIFRNITYEMRTSDNIIFHIIKDPG